MRKCKAFNIVFLYVSKGGGRGSLEEDNDAFFVHQIQICHEKDAALDVLRSVSNLQPNNAYLHLPLCFPVFVVIQNFS